MIKKDNNFAYIDESNLYAANKELEWKLDHKKSILQKEKAPNEDETS